MKINFCGASNTVTGSCHLITTDKHKILLDCGQFQGGKAQDALNYEPFPFDPSELDFMILSHPHIDHCGRIPLLVKKGFKGNIYCTDACADLLEVMLKDSGYIHEKEAEWANKKNERNGRPLVEPLYTFNDAMDALKFVKPVLYDQLVEINEDVKICFNDAGHILGSAVTELWIAEEICERNEAGEPISCSGERNVSKIVFSGDLGVMNRPILRNPTIIKKADYVIMETTYGNRVHPENAMDVKNLMDIIRETAARGGTTVIPAFAVGRTQELIYELNRVIDNDSEYRKDFENLKVYIDSPMATTATEVFRRNAQVFDDETKEFILKGDNPLDFKNLKFTRSSQDSMMLNANKEPKVIISASGMCEAGRIRHHLKHNLWDERNSIVFVGYQAEGSLGRLIVEGSPEVTLFGEKISVKAQIHNLQGFSGHADKNGLMTWLGGFEQEPKQIFLVHGEMDAKDDFAAAIKAELGYDPVVVRGNSEYVLEKDEIVNIEQAMAEAVDAETIAKTKNNLADIERRLEDIIATAKLAVDADIEPEKMARINNIVLELEKATINLGAEIGQ